MSWQDEPDPSGAWGDSNFTGPYVEDGYWLDGYTVDPAWTGEVVPPGTWAEV